VPERVVGIEADEIDRHGPALSRRAGSGQIRNGDRRTIMTSRIFRAMRRSDPRQDLAFSR